MFKFDGGKNFWNHGKTQGSQRGNLVARVSWHIMANKNKSMHCGLEQTRIKT